MTNKITHKHLNKGTMLVVIILWAVSVVRLSSSLYLPALPAMGDSLGLPINTLNLTLTIYFACFAVATLFAGPVTDALGRRVIVRTGLAVFTIGSIIAGTAGNSSMLLVGRAGQAIGAGFIPVACRVMVRDYFKDHEVISIIGWISTLGSLVPIIAPALGGFIVEEFGWRATFLVLTLGGAVTLASTWRLIPETMTTPQPLHPAPVLKAYLRMLQSGSFSLVITPLACCFIIQGAYFATAPYIFVSVFGLKPSAFGLINIALVLALLAGRQLSAQLSKKYSLFSLYMAFSTGPILSGLALMTLVKTGTANTWTFLVATVFFCLGFGGLIPIGTKSVLTAWRQQGGKASALFGCCTIGAMAAGSGAVNLLSTHAHEKLSSITDLTLVFGIVIIVTASLTRKRLA